MLKKLLLLCYFLCVANVTYAATPDIAPLEKLQAKYAQYENFSASFSQKLYNAEANDTEETTGTILFKKPMRIVWQTEGKVNEKIIVTDTTLWHYIPEDEVIFKYPVTMLDDIMPLLHIVTGQLNILAFFTPSVKQQTNTSITYVLTPKKEHPIIQTLQITVDTTKNELTSVTIVDYYKNQNTVTLRNITPNTKLQPDVFEFTPPAGVNVIDNYYENVN